MQCWKCPSFAGALVQASEAWPPLNRASAQLFPHGWMLYAALQLTRVALSTRHCCTRCKMSPQAGGTKRKFEGSADTDNKAARKKDSHLYTDDNPDTTLHGTGFQDSAAAQRTIHLVRKRSLTYQFQVVNTMYYRAKHHPHPNARMQSAMDIFQEWLGQYQTRKMDITKYKTVKRPLVAATLKAFEGGDLTLTNSTSASPGAFKAGLSWARIYVDMPTGKRLANTLTTTDPEQPDMDSLRTLHLQQLVPQDSSTAKQQAWRPNQSGPGRISDIHLQWLLFGYSPFEGQVKSLLAK